MRVQWDFAVVQSVEGLQLEGWDSLLMLDMCGDIIIIHSSSEYVSPNSVPNSGANNPRDQEKNITGLFD